MKHYLALDIGASSGRHIVGWQRDGKLKTEEVYRFPIGVTERDGHLVWDTDALLAHIKTGIAAAKVAYPDLVSLSIDTWGVDYVLLHGSKEVRPVYAYRDDRTEAIFPAVHAKLPFQNCTDAPGVSSSPSTASISFTQKLAGRLDGVTDFPMMPKYLLWKLCGVKVKEYTNATATGMGSVSTGEFDPEIISALGLPQIFPKLQWPRAGLGTYDGIKCVLCATHDTASAVEGIPMAGDQPYISCYAEDKMCRLPLYVTMEGQEFLPLHR